ncbi:MAG: DUF2147 domain-containing protein, partial [Pseudomonadota bacterium]
MKTLIASAALALFGAAAAADDVLGTWQSEPGDTGAFIHVTMAQCGTKICGTISDVIGSDDRSIVGRQMISDMSPNGGGAYSGGTIWAPDQDRNYRAKMSLAGDSLEVEGCVLGGAVCRGQTWSRV